MPLKPGAALLFDIDGTLVESDPLHLEAFNAIFGPYGHSFDSQSYGQKLQGLANIDIGARFFPDLPQERQWEIMMSKEAKFRELASEGMEPLPGLLALMDWADELGVSMVAVTNAPRANAELLLDAIGVRARFRHVIIGDELTHVKPHPMPYLEGLRLLGAEAAHAVAFEDSRTGIASATGAGIATIGMATGLLPDQLVEAGATLAAHDYTEPALVDLVRARLLQ